MILILVLYAIFAASVTASKLTLAYCPPFFLTATRMLISGSILLSYQYFYAKDSFRFKTKHIKYYLQVVFIGLMGAYILRLFALKHMTASKALFLQNVGPFMSALFAYMIFKHSMTRTQWVGLVLGFLGIIPILLTSDMGLHEFFFISGAEIAILLAAASYSWNWIIMQKLIRDKSYSPMMINGITMTTAGIFSLIISLGVEGVAPVTNWPYFLGLVAFIIIASNLISHNLYGYLLRSYSATFLSFAGFLSPIFAAIYGWAFFSEKITWHYWVSGAIVLGALYLYYKDELKVDTTKTTSLDV